MSKLSVGDTVRITGKGGLGFPEVYTRFIGARVLIVKESICGDSGIYHVKLPDGRVAQLYSIELEAISPLEQLAEVAE